VLVRETISFQRYKDPKEALFGGKLLHLLNKWTETLSDGKRHLNSNGSRLYHLITLGDSANTEFLIFRAKKRLQEREEDYPHKQNDKLKNNIKRLEELKAAGETYVYVNADYHTYDPFVAIFTESDEKEYEEVVKYLKSSANESISFERYRDPKEALFGENIKIDTIDYGTPYGSRCLDDNEIIEFLTNLSNETIKTLYTIPSYLVFRDTTDGFNFSNDYNIEDIFGKIVSFKGKRYGIPDVRPKITESISFERYRDPKEALGLGFKAAVKEWYDYNFYNWKEAYNEIGDKLMFGKLAAETVLYLVQNTLKGILEGKTPEQAYSEYVKELLSGGINKTTTVRAWRVHTKTIRAEAIKLLEDRLGIKINLENGKN